MALEFLSSSNVGGIAGTVWTFIMYFFYAVIIGGLVGGLILILIRALSFNYRGIIFKKMASGGIAIGVDRARIKKKDGIQSTVFSNRKGGFEGLPLRYVHPTTKKGIFDFLSPKNTFIAYSYESNEYVPTDVVEDFSKFVFKPKDTAADMWAAMETKKVREKYMKQKWWQHPNAGAAIIITGMLMGMILIIVMMRTGLGG